MAKYVVECPACHKAHQAGGFFGKKQIKCTCGYLIDVSAEKMAQDECPHCGNIVIYDRSKSKSASCPVCHAKINSGTEKVEITCPSCKLRLSADKNAKTYTCPQCKVVIDVQSRLAQINSSKKAQVIKWDMGMNDVFVYRHPVENFKIGSQLIVTEGQKAIFFRNGEALDVFGPGRHTLETQNLPLIEEVLKYPTDADLTFDSQVYFVRTNRLNVKWGIPSIELRNPGMDFYVDIGASGSADMEVIEGNENIRKLLATIIGSVAGPNDNSPRVAGESYTSSYISEKFRDLITSRLGSLLAEIIIENNINVLDIASKKTVIGDMLSKDYNGILEEYGLVIPDKHFFVTNIKIHNSEQVETWRRQEADRVLKVREENVLKAEAEARQGRVLVEEQTEAQRKILRTQGEGEEIKITAKAKSEAVKFEAEGNAEATKLTGQASAEAYKAQAIAEAEEMRAKGYTYGQETQRQIGLEAMQNGLPGTGNGGATNSGIGSALGDMVGLGVGLSAMGGVVNMTKDIMNPIINQVSDIGKQPTETVQPQTNLVSAWNCACGKSCITTKFCPECGSQKPVDVINGLWNCTCGQVGINTNFCPNCGARKPVNNATWNCTNCGQTDITSNFCPNCGNKKGV